MTADKLIEAMAEAGRNTLRMRGYYAEMPNFSWPDVARAALAAIDAAGWAIVPKEMTEDMREAAAGEILVACRDDNPADTAVEAWAHALEAAPKVTP